MNKMFVVTGIVLVASVIVYIELPALKEKELKREIYLFGFFLLVGIGLNMVSSLHLKFPNLLDWLAIVYKPISQLVFN